MRQQVMTKRTSAPLPPTPPGQPVTPLPIDLHNAFNSVVRAETPPPSEDFLSLGRELNKARLFYFIQNEAFPGREPLPPAPSYCRGLLLAATRLHEARLDAATHARVQDEAFVQRQLASIEEDGHWPDVRDELCKFYSAVREELRRREPPPAGPPDANPLPPTEGKPVLDPESAAIAALFKFDGASMTEIAAIAGVDRPTLYTFPKFLEAAKLVGKYKPRKGAKDKVRGGFKDGDGTLEAFADEDEDAT
jgi:hypothetical protein